MLLDYNPLDDYADYPPSQNGHTRPTLRHPWRFPLMQESSSKQAYPFHYHLHI
jgi:hypothetical protein